MKYRVMVVDDYPDAAAAVATLLRLLGHEVREATSGRAAVELATSFDPQVGLIDIGLPDLSGLEVARSIRAHFGQRPLFLAAISGWGQPEDRVRAIAAGFDHHVLKPIDGAIIKRILQLAETRLSELAASSA
ncbi:MAG: response regulator [Myxococcota bacterium]|nr:response regulator [Myxococcota bacterium]